MPASSATGRSCQVAGSPIRTSALSVHQGECSEVLTGLHRDYDRSNRGHWRSSSVVRAAANGVRCGECMAPRDPTEEEIEAWMTGVVVVAGGEE